jgi:hypothetical protein
VPQVDVDIALREAGEDVVNAKFSDDQWEINVRAQASEFLALREIRTMDWNSRRAAKVGTSAGAAVFWCSDGEAATIWIGTRAGMIGHDDETWDVAISVPLGIVDDLVRQVEGL